MLDRGEQNDWFGSPEIIIEGVVAVCAFWMFIWWTTLADRPFLNPALLKDRNFVGSCVLIFVVGIILYATLALLPPMLQDLMNYPVTTAGLVMMPRTGMDSRSRNVLPSLLLPGTMGVTGTR